MAIPSSTDHPIHIADTPRLGLVPVEVPPASGASGPASPLTVLITNQVMDWPSGTVIYARDLALELLRRGHRPIVYTWFPGRISRQLEAAGVEVVTSLWRLGERPDVIHGHHRRLVRGALLRFPDVPVVAFCHNPTDPWDAPTPDAGIARYCGVSSRCAERLMSIGAPAAATEVRPNFVDLNRFAIRNALPAEPRRALVFSNYASSRSYLPTIGAAASRLGMSLDVVGHDAHHESDEPERLLSSYDLVFAVGKSALEAMAVGCAVVLCDRPGLGPMVTAGDFVRLRQLNFGLMTLTQPITEDGIARECARYDPADAERVRTLVRSYCGLERAVDDLLALYRQVIADRAAAVAGLGAGNAVPRRRSSPRHWMAGFRYRLTSRATIAFYRAAGPGPRRVPPVLLPPYRLARTVFRRLAGVR